MGMVARGSGKVQSPRRKSATGGTNAGALRVDVDIRLKANGLRITRVQIATAIAALATLGWAAMHFH
jgi:hypothetical protein